MRVSKSLLARFGTVIAAAGIAVGSVAATADASTAHKVKTVTILKASAKPVHVSKRHPYGTAHIVGQLTTAGTPAGQVTGARINLWREGAKGRWHLVQHARTGYHGFVRFRVFHVGKGATFQLRFPGNRNFAHSRSSVIVISAVS
jgi:hypothetical protein